MEAGGEASTPQIAGLRARAYRRAVRTQSISAQAWLASLSLCILPLAAGAVPELPDSVIEARAFLAEERKALATTPRRHELLAEFERIQRDVCERRTALETLSRHLDETCAAGERMTPTCSAQTMKEHDMIVAYFGREDALEEVEGRIAEQEGADFDVESMLYRGNFRMCWCPEFAGDGGCVPGAEDVIEQRTSSHTYQLTIERTVIRSQ